MALCPQSSGWCFLAARLSDRRIHLLFRCRKLARPVADDRSFVDPNLAGLLTVVEIDHPFAGTVKVGPEALVAVLKDFAEVPPQR